MFDYNQLQALKELVVGDQQEDEMVQNHYKGSVLNPGDIGADGKKKQVARPYAKVQAKLGKKYEQKKVEEIKEKAPQKKQTKKQNKKAIWTEQQVSELPVSKNDIRKTPQFQTLYRQKVGTEDLYLGLSGVDPSSAHCNEIMYKIKLPGVTMKQISLDITQKAMVLQTKDFYLHQYFQYKIDSKQSKAKFISDKQILQLIFSVTKELNL